jgi:hypothetical protein
MSQVPAKEPINRSMIIAGVVEAILLLIPSKILFQLLPFLIPIRAANAADSNSANWFAPPKLSSPYK